MLTSHNISFYFTISNHVWYCNSKYGQVEITMLMAANLLIYILVQTIMGEGDLSLPFREKQMSPFLQYSNFLISGTLLEGTYLILKDQPLGIYVHTTTSHPLAVLLTIMALLPTHAVPRIAVQNKLPLIRKTESISVVYTSHL